jgi:hypothetical protein
MLVAAAIDMESGGVCAVPMGLVTGVIAGVATLGGFRFGLELGLELAPTPAHGDGPEKGL